MAIFSRGKRDRPGDGAIEEPTRAADSAAQPIADDATAPTEAAASVEISVSAFRGVGAAAPPPPARRQPAREVAPPASETIAGLRDNVLLAEALAALPDAPTPPQIIEVARQLLQGQLFLRVKGDARSLLSEGRPLPLAIATLGDETFVVAYSNGAALAASLRGDGNDESSAMGQSALAVLRYAIASPYAGLVVDPASTPARVILRRDMLERMVDGIDPQLELKTLLTGERTAATASTVADALGRVPFWVAVSRVGESGRLGVAEARTTEGERYLEVFSHPLEVVALGRGDKPAPMTGAQLAKALRGDAGLTGVIVDPAGPWIRLTRSDLAGIPVA
jgi:hypothetical protein